MSILISKLPETNDSSRNAPPMICQPSRQAKTFIIREKSALECRYGGSRGEMGNMKNMHNQQQLPMASDTALRTVRLVELSPMVVHD
jgi:hypothetical protein